MDQQVFSWSRDIWILKWVIKILVFTTSSRTVRCRRRRHRISVLELSEFKKTLIWKVFNMSSSYQCLKCYLSHGARLPIYQPLSFGAECGFFPLYASSSPVRSAKIATGRSSLRCTDMSPLVATRRPCAFAQRLSRLLICNAASNTSSIIVTTWEQWRRRYFNTVRIIITTYCTDVLLINSVYTTRRPTRASLLLTEEFNIVH